ncbi:MAG: ABC transporter permease [Longimicrobiales bacterium]
MRDVWAVIKREYLQRVRSKWFIIGTIGGPLFMLALFVVPAWFASQGARSERILVVADETGLLAGALTPRLEDAGWTVSSEAWSADLVERLSARASDGDIGGFLLLDERTVREGHAVFYGEDSPSTLRRITIRQAVVQSALEYQLSEQGVDVGAFMSGGDLEVELLSGDGAGTDDPQFAVAYVGSFILYMVILLYSVAVMRSTLEEKTNRVVEVIISAMRPWHLMLGKILGVGAVSLTQLGVWVGAGALMMTMGLPMLIAARPELATLEGLSDVMPGIGLVGLFIAFFVFGFFMFSGLYAAVGAMCSSDEEAQQAQVPVMIFLIVPIIVVIGIIEDPNSTLAVGMSLFPLFSPMLMFARVAGGGVPMWQVGLSFALMAVTVVAIAWLAGRIYKVGILMAGKRPTFPELVRWVREA